MNLRKSRHPIALVIAVITIGILLVGLMFWVFSAVFLYRTVDPAPYRFNAIILNDTPEGVLLRECDPQGCAIFYEPLNLQPENQISVVTSADDSPHWWVISNEAGMTTGCLNLQFTRKIPDLVVKISDLQACTPDNPDFIPAPLKPSSAH